MEPRPVSDTFLSRAALCAGTPLLLWLSFPPADLGPLAWVALVPLLLYIRGETRGGRLLRWGWVSGLLYYSPSVYWIHHVTWVGYFALSAYLALYILLFSWLLRLLIPSLGYRFYWGVPIVYAACEHLRAWVITGFPWFDLGHTQHAWLRLIQVLDLTGVAGLTFLVALANALAAGLVLLLRERGRAGLADKEWWGSFAGFLLLLGGTLAYGGWRLDGVKRVEGPEVGLVQGNIPQEVKELQQDLSDEEWQRRYDAWWDTHVALTDRMLEGRGKPPDLIVWAETMYPEVCYTVRERGRYPDPSLVLKDRRGNDVLVNSHLERLFPRIRKWGTRFLMGAETVEYSLEKQKGRRRSYNSAYLLDPKAGWQGRYDKMRLVILGEYVPLQDDYPWVEGLMKRISKLVVVPDLSRGTEVTNFALGTESFGTPICFEIMFADACREFVRGGATFLVTLSNDGWFKDSAELDQILAVTKLRAVENRIGIVRATNTGISAFVTPWGTTEEVLAVDGRTKEVAGTLCRRVLLRTETTFYTRHGDWLARGCVALVVLAVALRAGVRLGRGLISMRRRVA